MLPVQSQPGARRHRAGACWRTSIFRRPPSGLGRQPCIGGQTFTHRVTRTSNLHGIALMRLLRHQHSGFEAVGWLAKARRYSHWRSSDVTGLAASNVRPFPVSWSWHRQTPNSSGRHGRGFSGAARQLQ
jgi:hypothetical protein